MATTNFYVTPENGFPQLPNSTMLYISNNKEIYYNYNMHKHELVYIKVTPTTNLPLPPQKKESKGKKKKSTQYRNKKNTATQDNWPINQKTPNMK